MESTYGTHLRIATDNGGLEGGRACVRREVDVSTCIDQELSDSEVAAPGCEMECRITIGVLIIDALGASRFQDKLHALRQADERCMHEGGLGLAITQFSLSAVEEQLLHHGHASASCRYHQ